MMVYEYQHEDWNKFHTILDLLQKIGYSTTEAVEWLTSEQNLLENKIPLKLIEEGDIEKLIQSLEPIYNGTYI